MSEQDSTRPDPPPGHPDHDPAATGFPDVRAIPRGERQVGAVSRLVTQQRDDAGREALMTVRRALHHGVTIVELATVLDHLTNGTVAACLQALEDLGNQAGGR
jgi:alkylhydroperoxidase/carboxymuconolactone decarboxylase family protein YurZ